jgi:filamentous hemagglutinin family protein
MFSQHCLRLLWLISGIMLVQGAIAPAVAQLTPDPTTRTAVTQTSPNTYTITGGVQPRNGQNLFHSFRAFNVGTGTTVRVNDPGVNNILLRVTGNTPSRIQGRLQVNGNANLFLLNPNGIVFGRTAILDVRGSFLATTADAIQLGNQGSFSATTTAVPLLTVSPSAFLFSGNAGAIVNRSTVSLSESLSETDTSPELTGLQVPSRQSLVLLGGDVTLQGGSLTAWGGRVEVAGVAGRGAVELSQQSGLHLVFPDRLSRAAVRLVNASIHVASGNLLLAADSLTLLRSNLNADNTMAVQAPAGNITMRAQDQIFLIAGSDIFSDTVSSQNAGRIRLMSGRAIDLNSSTVSTRTSSRGSAGEIEIVTGRLTIGNGGLVSATASGAGNAGRITVQAHDAITLTQGSISTSKFSQTGNGAGDIILQTPRLAVRQLGTIRAVDEGQGRGGNITIAAQVIALDGANIANPTNPASDENLESMSTETRSANGGNITLQNVDLLLLTRQARISTNAGTARRGGNDGNGGNITIEAQFIAANPFGNSDITANAFEGQGGQVNITTASIFGIAARPRTTSLTSDITASSDRGVQGEVNISPPEVDPSRGLTELPTNFADASTQLPHACRVLGASTQGEFVITGRGGLPPNPADFGGSEPIAANWASLDHALKAQEPTQRQPVSPQIATGPASQNWKTQGIEAQGWLLNAAGQVVLVAQIPEAERSPIPTLASPIAPGCESSLP